jgi:glutamate racemase
VRIGVFDSGFGGLTVLRALLARLPHADYVYLGDTARLPYGSKSQSTIERYAVSATQFLEEQGAELLVIACNTASALALPAIENAAHVKVVGVVQTGAAAAAEVSSTRDVIVLGTTATVESRAYAAACATLGLRAAEKACPLLVPLVEEGWTDHAVTSQVMDVYLDEAAQQASAAGLHPDALVLGCTHYPLLRALFESKVAGRMQVIDSADVTAARVYEIVGAGAKYKSAAPALEFFVTDSAKRFQTLGSRFLARPIHSVELVDLGD